MKTRGLSCFCFIVLCAACKSPSGTKAAPPPDSRFVKTLTLPSFEPTLPESPFRDAFIGNCVMCHSARYIFDQPKFPRKTWTAEVNKMIASYGAPVSSGAVADIVNYLVAVNGTEDAPAPPGANTPR